MGCNQWNIILQSVFLPSNTKDLPVNQTQLFNEFCALVKDSTQLVLIEDSISPGVLYPFVCQALASQQLQIPIKSHTVNQFGYSFRSLQECMEFFEFTPANLL